MTDRIKAERIAAKLVGIDEMSSPTKIIDTFEEEVGQQLRLLLAAATDGQMQRSKFMSLILR